jgi:hypothetical protein
MIEERFHGDPIERVHGAADYGIRRGLSFVVIAIGTVMAGLSFQPYLAVKTGAILVSLTTLVLVMKGLHAPARDYRQTEVWILLDKTLPLPTERAQMVIGATLRDRYAWHAGVVAAIALALWGLTASLSLYRLLQA